eukprot:TRINITY_DN2432_c0_g1_i3.p3 TRINITY_DN2432_c0_g1~~TRINITY_DN2432_c0_g1_i3.p3  ORF type:complete len:126 (-),score=1.35 TRINITY_DN2432_c0_g1_i3:749-1126(-)
MATVAACARSAFRSSSLRSAARKLAAEAKAAPSPFRIAKQKPLSHRIFRSPVEMSCCVESLMPLHGATASSLLVSMLSVSRRGHGWLCQVLTEARGRTLVRWQVLSAQCDRSRVRVLESASPKWR